MVMTKDRGQEYLADYEKKRKPKKSKSLFKISNLKIEDIDPGDAVLISQLAENSRVGWAALGKRIAESKTVKGVFKKLGIEKEYEEFIDVLITAGEKIEEYATDVRMKEMVAVQKAAVKEGLTKLTNGIAVKASELAEKVDKIGKKQPMPVTDHIKNAAKLLTAVRQVAHVAQAVTAALHSEENLLNLRHFPYWLERQLVKTRLWQAELELINNAQSGYKVEPSDKKWMEGLSNSQLNNLQKQLFGIALVSDLDGLSIKEYRKQLTDKINDLLVISTKPERSAKEQEIIKNNEDILNHLMDGTHIKTDAVIALVAHLEKERILEAL